MATPESNALLAMQLFRQPAEDYADRSNQRLKVLMGIAQANREEQVRRELTASQQQLQRDLTEQGYQKSIELANMTADRAERADVARGQRETNRLESLQSRDDARATAAEQKQLRALISKVYYEYALEAQEAGVPVRPRTDFTDDDAGLGELTQEFAKAKKANLGVKQEGSANVVVSLLDRNRGELEQAKTELEGWSKPTDEDREEARALAIKAVESAIEQKSSGTEKLTKAQIAKGIKALRDGDDAVAKEHLGATVFAGYQNALTSTLRGLLNTPERKQQRDIASRNFLALQSQAKDLAHSAIVASQQNSKLASKVGEALSPIQRMVSAPLPALSVEDFVKQRTTPPAGAQSSAAPAATQPTPEYKNPWYSVLGAYQRGVEHVPAFVEGAAMAPVRILDKTMTIPYTGIRGLITGDYSIPKNGPLQSGLGAIGSGLGGLIAGDPYAQPPAPVPTPQRSVFPVSNRDAEAERRARALEILLQGGY